MLIDRTEKILSLQLEWIKNADAKVPPPVCDQYRNDGSSCVIDKNID